MHRRPIIALVGGGQIGSTLALMIAQREMGDVVLIDLPHMENPLRGKTLDISALRPHYRSDIHMMVSCDFSALSGADVVIITAGMARKPHMTRDDLLGVNLDIIQHCADQVSRHAPDSLVLLSTNPVDAMALAFFNRSGLPKTHVVGLSGALDSGRFRTFIAMETGFSVEDVYCMVMGGHGPTMIPIARTATVAGIPLQDLLSRERINAVIERTREAGTEIVHLLGTGSAFYSPAAAILEMVESHLLDKKRVFSSSALCHGAFGIDGYFLGVPCVIGAGGVERILEFPLEAHEQAMLDHTYAAVRASCAGLIPPALT